MIVETAAMLFLEHSFERATMRSIGAAVGIDPATIYSCFSSKEAIVVQILQTGVDDLLTALQSAMNGHDEPEAQFRAAVRAHVVHAITGPYQALYDQVFPYLPDEGRAGVRAQRDLIDELWQTRVQRAIAAGMISARNPSLARLHLLTAMNGIYRWFRPGAPLSVNQVADALVDMVDREASETQANPGEVDDDRRPVAWLLLRRTRDRTAAFREAGWINHVPDSFHPTAVRGSTAPSNERGSTCAPLRYSLKVESRSSRREACSPFASRGRSARTHSPSMATTPSGGYSGRSTTTCR
jgi:AcrR family transcriptional regulator